MGEGGEEPDLGGGESEESGEETALLTHSSSSLEGLDFDRLLVERLGEFGRHQKILYFFFCLPAALTAAITMASVFTSFSPPHRCLVPLCDDATIQEYSDPWYFGWANFSLPDPTFKSPSSSASCAMFSPTNTSTTCTAASFSNTSIKCSSHVFDHQDMAASLVTEFHLVCGEEWRLPLSQSVFFAGVLVGALLFGYLGDSLGRRTAFLIGMLETTVCGLGAAFAPNMAVYSGLMFFTAMGQVGVFQCCFVLAIETVGPSKRVFCGVVIEFFFVAGEVVLALLAWWLRDWRKLQLGAVLPGVFFLTYYFFLPKSVRWLVQGGKHSAAREAINKIARGNGVQELAEAELQHFRTDGVSAPEGSEGLAELFRRPTLRLRLLNVWFNWFVITMVYYGLSLNAASLAGDVFTNFALLSLAEFPGYCLSYLGMLYLGRRATLASSLTLGGLACLAASLMPASLPALGTICYLLGKFGATAAFGTTYLYTSELFPTGVRNACVGLSSMVGRVGAILSPYVASLGLLTGLQWLPMAVFAALATVSGLLTLLLPETLGVPLPGTMQEAENMGKEGRTMLVNSHGD